MLMSVVWDDRKVTKNAMRFPDTVQKTATFQRTESESKGAAAVSKVMRCLHIVLISARK